MINRRRHGIWLSEELVFPYLIGAAMIGAGLGARYGDRLWLGDNFRVFRPNIHKQSSKSSRLSIAVVIVGVVLTVYSLLSHFFS